MRHEDVVKKNLPACLNRTPDEWLCDPFAELNEEIESWKWDDATPKDACDMKMWLKKSCWQA